MAAQTRFTNLISSSEISLPDIAAANTGQVSTLGSNSTIGDLIMPLRAGLSVKGAFFWWPGGFGALSIKVSLWDGPGSTRLASITVAVNSAGIYLAMFDGPVSVTAAKYYYITTYETSGTKIQYFTTANIAAITGSTMVLSDFNNKVLSPGYWRKTSWYATGDAIPASEDATSIYGIIQPIFV